MVFNAEGVVFIAPVIWRQASFCIPVSLMVAVFCSTFGHHASEPKLIVVLTMVVCGHRTIFGLSLHVFPKLRLQFMWLHFPHWIILSMWPFSQAYYPQSPSPSHLTSSATFTVSPLIVVVCHFPLPCTWDDQCSLWVYCQPVLYAPSHQHA